MSASRIYTTGAPPSFGEWLSRQRKARDLTQEDLAERIGCSVWSIQKIEAGNRRPSRQVAQILADYFEVPPAELETFLQFARGKSREWDASQLLPAGPDESVEPPNNLPVQLTSFIGRDIEVPRVRDLMLSSAVRLLTLTGPPGTGKTRLALRVAAELLKDFKDGVFFINLAPISDPNLVVPEIAQTLGVSASGLQPLIDLVEAQIGHASLLLVLDNFEQVVGASPEIGRLLVAAPKVKVMATSRVPLHIRGEKEFTVPPLQLPDADHLPPLDRLRRYEAVRLFVERAGDVMDDFQLSPDSAPAVARFCARLDGLPLAIELAAARVKALSPEAILSRSESRLQLLTGGPRDLPARQRTLRSAIEWSYGLLSEPERRLFCRLAVFVGGRSLAAIAEVCSEPDPLDHVSSLVGMSLLQRVKGVGGEPRFVMLETIHEYAHEMLEESG